MFTSEFPIKGMEGEKLQLRCSVYSKDVYVEWYKGDDKINDDENILIESDGMHHCMTIQQVKLSDAGQYIIVAGNVRKQVTVNVQAMFTSEFNPIKCIEGEKLQLACSVYSEDVFVEWYKGDVRINDNENILIESDGMHHCMTIQQVKLSDAGQYIIVAGNVRKQVTVNVEVLPVCINRLHEKDRRRYIELVQSSEMEKRYYVRIMIVGKESVRETCLVGRLLKESIGDVTSTDGIDITVHQCKIDIEDGTWMIDKYKAADKVDRIKRTLKPVPIENRKKGLLKTNTFLGIDHEHSDAQSSRASNEEFINVEVQAEDQNNMKSTPNLLQPETTYLVDKTSKQANINTNINMKDDENVLNTNKSLTLVMPSDLRSRVFSTTSTSTIPSNHYALCGFLDFAGQQEFYATHQAFLTSSTIYLLVADMADDIFKLDLKQGFADFQHVGEYVDLWFDTIHCHQTVQLPVTGPPLHCFIDPPVILVLSGKDKNEKEVEKRKKELQIQLDTVLGYQSKYHHLREIICLSNKTDQDLKFEELKHKISEIVMRMDSWGQRLPLKWILLEHLIDINKYDGKKFINFSDMVILAKHRDILILDNEDLKLFLRFQHEVGNIIYFEDVEDFIILDPKYLVESFRCLVSDKIDDKLQHRVYWTEFVRSGQISEYLMSELFKSKCGNQFSGQIENLLKVMEKFDILAKIGDTRLYIMPSMMPSTSFDKLCQQIGVEQPNCQRTSWLSLKFSFLPPAFINHILVWFVRKYDHSKGENTIKSLELFRGNCVFDIDKSGVEKLLVTMSTDTIAIQLLSFSTRKSEFGSICINIRKELMEKIEYIKDRYKWTISCEIRFKCSTGHHFENTVSYKDLKSSIEYYCNQHKGVHQSKQTYGPWMKMTEDDLIQQEIPDLNHEDIIDDSEFSPRAAKKTGTKLESQYTVRRPPAASHVKTISSYSSSTSQDLPTGGPQSDTIDVLNIPVDQYIPFLKGWPSLETYSLSMIKKGKKQLDQDFQSDKTYYTDPRKLCRVLCILNKQSGDKALYHGNRMDIECTWLQQMKKQFKWDLQKHTDKTSDEIFEILENEMNRDFTVNHSLFVIIISRGDQYGMYGTHGERIKYWAITSRFDEVQGLKGKPKIFILDDCDIGVQETDFTNPKPLIRTVSGREILADQRGSVLVPTNNQDTYICKASTIGRCDLVVKGSWVLGALWSVMCKAANYMTFKQMMRQVQLMIQDAIIPEGKPDPDMTITDDLTKDFYMLPPPS